MRIDGKRIDGATTRIDTLCGRLARPTTYRLSVFVPDDGRTSRNADTGTHTKAP